MYHHDSVCQIISEFGIKKKEEIISVPSKTVYKFEYDNIKGLRGEL